MFRCFALTLGVVFKWTHSHYQPLSLMLSHIFPNQRLHVLECVSVICYYGTVYPRTLWLKTASLFVHNSLGWDLGKGLTSQFSALHSIIWDHYLAAFGWWLALDGMSKRLFSLIRHPSAPLSGHFLCGGPRVNEFFLFGWLIRGTFQEIQKQTFPAVNHRESLLSHSVGPTWSQGQPRFIGRGKRKRIAKNL